MSLVIRLRDAALLGLVITLTAAAPAALAQTPAPPPASATPPINLAEHQLLLRLVNGVSLQHYLEQLGSEFANLDADGDGKLTQRDVELHTLMEMIQIKVAAWTGVMRYDLDGDGFVTEDEVRRAATYDMRWSRAQAASGKSPLGSTEETIDRMVAVIMVLDTDKDGKVSLTEAGKFGEGPQRQNVAINGYAARTRQALALETDTAGELPRAAYEAAGEALFRRVDADNDGKISQQELTDYRRKPAQAGANPEAAEAAQRRKRELAELTQKRQAAIDAERAVCAMPAPSGKARVVLLGAYETESLSSLTIGSQDAVINAGRVNIEPGDEPLYVVIASFIPTIWQFGGAVERVERVVLTSSSTGRNSSDPKQPPVAGATGVARDRVSFFSRPNCVSYFYETPASGSLQAAGAIRAATGRAPDVIAGQYAVSTFNVPSGRIDTVKERGQRPAIRKGSNSIVGPGNIIIQFGPSRASDDALLYWPGGVVEIDPKAVVASAPVAPYEVLPAQAGLAQLLANGGITQNKAGEFVVRSKMRFPPGLYGAHSVTFLVMKGAPYPDGDPGHSCVIMEETGESKGAGCRSR